MYFPFSKLHGWGKRTACQPQTIYCESVAFTVKMDSNASGSPLAGQPPLMQNKYPCANVFHDLRRTEKRMGIYSEVPRNKRIATGSRGQAGALLFVSILTGKLE